MAQQRRIGDRDRQVSGRTRTSSHGASCRLIAGASVNVGGISTITDSYGRYSFNLSPGQVSAIVSAPGYQTASGTAVLNDYFPNNLDFFLTAVPCPLSSADPSVTICTPAPNATVKSPVKVVAGSRDSAAPVTNMFIWVDGVKKWTTSGGTVNTSLPMTIGKRRVTVQAKDSAGRYFQSTIYVNVQ